jgi:hypothetical protein
MRRFIDVYVQPDGQAPMIGDADDGRLHVRRAASLREPRRHGLGLPVSHDVGTAASVRRRRVEDGAFSYPAGGFHVLRHGQDHAVVRCGAVGLRGAGSHDHNDQLGLELVVGGRRIVADSGTYAYTRDLRARHAFRIAAAHSVWRSATRSRTRWTRRGRGACWRTAPAPGARSARRTTDGWSSRASTTATSTGRRARCAACGSSRGTRTVHGCWRTWWKATGEEVVAWRLHLACALPEARLHGGRPAPAVRTTLAGAVGSWRLRPGCVPAAGTARGTGAGTGGDAGE